MSQCCFPPEGTGGVVRYDRLPTRQQADSDEQVSRSAERLLLTPLSRDPSPRVSIGFDPALLPPS